MSKRLPAFGVLAIGVIVLVVLFANNLFSVSGAFEDLTDGFRPAMSDEALATAKADVAALGAVSDEFSNQIAPAVAQALQMSGDELNTFLGTNFPAVAHGVSQLPDIVSELSGVMDLLSDQQSNFEKADAIPMSSLPVTTVPWIILLIGIAAIVVAIVMLGKVQQAWLIAVILGVVVVAVAVGLSFLPKANAADDLNDALRPVYTEELVAYAGQSVGVVGAMGQQLQAEMLPALAQQLDMDEAAMQDFLGGFPATSGALADFDATLDRFQGLVTTFDSQLDNYNAITDTVLSPVVLVVLVGGLLIIVCGIWAFLAARRDDSEVAEQAQA